jgi:hypothetical protein
LDRLHRLVDSEGRSAVVAAQDTSPEQPTPAGKAPPPESRSLSLSLGGGSTATHRSDGCSGIPARALGACGRPPRRTRGSQAGSAGRRTTGAPGGRLQGSSPARHPDPVTRRRVSRSRAGIARSRPPRSTVRCPVDTMASGRTWFPYGWTCGPGHQPVGHVARRLCGRADAVADGGQDGSATADGGPGRRGPGARRGDPGSGEPRRSGRSGLPLPCPGSRMPAHRADCAGQLFRKASRSALNSCSWAPVSPWGAPG